MHGDDGDLIQAFWQQATARIGEITDLALALEGGDLDAGHAVKRHLHTMKGEAHMLDLTECAELVQWMEELVVRSPHGLSSDAADALLTSLDVIAVMASSQGAAHESLPDVLARLREVAAACDAPAEAAGAPDTPARRPSARPPEGASDGSEQHEAAQLDPLVLSPLVHEALRLHREQQLLQPKIREVRRMLRALLAEIDPSVGADSLAERIVKTLNYGAELERRMTELMAQWSTSEFALENALERIEETVRAAAMVSVGRLKSQVHRAGRAAASALGKRVQITVTGDAYVDATVERSLGPALLHLVRNAVDHGVEMPDERTRVGKAVEGRVDVSIHQSDSSVRVVVTDDGRGVDRERLRARIDERNPGDAPRDDEELLQRIFEHGISTRDEATDLSGRGVGLDVVARQVGMVGGNVRVESTRGAGTRFELVLPTMLRADIVVPVEVRGVRLALPARAVVGVERIREIVQASDGWRLPRGARGAAELVPLFDLSAVLFESGDGPQVGDPAIVVQHRTGFFAARVDRYDNPRALSFERIEELPISSDLVRGVAAAPDGGVFFLLDADALYDALRGRRTTITAAAPRKKSARQRHVLVVEDAPVARELLLGLLRSFGLRVSDAADGREGLRAAQAERPDLVLTDIEMPFLGGLEMIAELRRDARLAETPVVVLTTRSDEPVKERARALGVRFFLSKQRFVESELRRVIDECLSR